MPQPPAPPARLVVLVSGTGTNLGALLDACRDPAYGARVVAVGSDRADTLAAARAAAQGVPTFVVRPEDFPDRAAWDDGLADRISVHRPDLVVSAGFLRLLGPAVLRRWPDRIVNTHPALLPAFPGTRAARDALAYGVRVSGCTVHLVDAGVDSGPVLAQVAVPVEDGDDEHTLHERIKSVERPLLAGIVGRMIREGWTVEGRRVTIP